MITAVPCRKVAKESVKKRLVKWLTCQLRRSEPLNDCGNVAGGGDEMREREKSKLLALALIVLFCLQEVWALGPADCNGVTVICLKSAPAKLDRAGATYILTQDIVSSSKGFDIATDNVTIDGQGHTLTYTTGSEGAGVYALDRKGITVKNLIVRKSGGWGTIVFLLGGAHSIVSNAVGSIAFLDSSNNVIRNNAVNGKLGIVAWHRKTGSNDNLIEHNTFVHDSKGRKVFDNFIDFAGSSNNVFTNNVVTLLNTVGSEIMQISHSHFNTFSNNKLTLTGTGMISVRDGSSSNLFENNEIYTTDQGFSIGQGDAGTGGPHHNTFKDNQILVDHYGVNLHSGSNSNTFETNFIVTEAASVKVQSSSGGDNQFLGNTIYSRNNQPFSSEKGFTKPIRFRNNIFYAVNRVAFHGSNMNIDSDHNLFYRRGGGDLILYLGTYYKSLGSYKQVSNRDLNSINADPLFVDIQNQDFRPRPGSPVCKAGEGKVEIGAFPCGDGTTSETQ